MRIPVPGTDTFVHLNLVNRVFRPSSSIKNAPASHTLRLLECQIEDHSGEQPVVTAASATGIGRTTGDEGDMPVTPAHEKVLARVLELEAQLANAQKQQDAAPAEKPQQSERDARAWSRTAALIKRLRQDLKQAGVQVTEEAPEPSGDYAEADADDLFLLDLHERTAECEG